MSALSFLVSGGMASVGGNLPENEQSPLEAIGRALATQLQKLALSRRIPPANIPALRASTFIAAVDQKYAHFVIADAPGQTTIRYHDARIHGEVPEGAIAEDVRLQIGDPLVSFRIPLEQIAKANEMVGPVVDMILKDAMPKPTSEIDEALCFVIMSFSGNAQLSDFYEYAIKPAITEAGYRAQRVDEQHFNGSIRDQIIQNIKSAKLIVADMTEARPNCYYELGIAHSLQKNVIHLSRNATDIHFDVKDFNFIIYSNISDLKSKLHARIANTIK